MGLISVFIQVTIMFNCKICTASYESIRQFSRHIGTHSMSKQEYYDKYIGTKGKCKNCSKDTKFLGITKGYSPYCSRSCQVKLSWSNDSERKIALSKRLSKNNIGKPGARKGKKNKNEYPKTEKVLQRMRDLHSILKSRNHWHNCNIKMWAKRTDEEVLAIIKKRDETRLKNILEAKESSKEFTINERTYNSLCEAFDVNG